MIIKQVVIAVISSSLLACASTDEASSDGESSVRSSRSNCILRSSIRGYSVLDESNLIIDGIARRKYHMVLQRRAYGLKSSLGIEFDSKSSRVCARFDNLTYGGGFADSRFVRIASIRELSPEEHEYLLIQFGKKKPEIEQGPVPREVKGAEVEELDPAAADESSGN